MLNKFVINPTLINEIIDEKFTFFDSETSQMISLNESATLVMNAIQLRWSLDKLKQKFKEQYDVSEKKLDEDIHKCLDILVEKKVIVNKR